MSSHTRYSDSRNVVKAARGTVKADDKAGSCADRWDRIVVCSTEYWKNIVSFVLKSLRMEQNTETEVSHATYKTMLDQARLICQDYIHQRLSERNMTRKLKFTGDNLTTQSYVYISVGRVLLKMHPSVYTDISRKIGRTMSSPGIVKATLSDVLDILFRDTITWGKIVSMFVIAGSFAEECVQQGHSSFVNDVVDTVVGFVAMHLVEWLSYQGGWVGLDNVIGDKKEYVSKSFFIGVCGAFLGFVAVTLSLVSEIR